MLQLQRPQPGGTQQTRHIACNGNKESQTVDCIVEGFTGIMRLSVNEHEGYFKIPETTHVHIVAKPGQSFICTALTSQR